MMTTRAHEQARAHLAHIEELLRRLHEARDAGDEAAEDAARAAIEELPLEVTVRSGWRRPGEDAGTPEEYQILLATGGPAVRIVGDLNHYGEPTTAVLEYADWGTPWTTYPADIEEAWVLLEFARQFYYGG